MKITNCNSGRDGSQQYNMMSDKGGVVQFATFDDEMCAHTWHCPGEGKQFLAALEEHANKIDRKLTIPTVINPKLANILSVAGYVKTYREVVCMGMVDTVELWIHKREV